MEYAEIGIIGGSGFYTMPGLEDPQYIKIYTPYGRPSEKILIGKIKNRKVAFLARHGIGHYLSPSEINYRANLYAFKLLNVQHIISITAVGSLKEQLKPTELVIPDQYFDATYKRDRTFFEQGIVAHVSMATPTCPHDSKQAPKIANEIGLSTHLGGIYLNIEGPHFSSQGESEIYRKMNFDIIGMTQAIEAKLAKEVEICFLPLAFITDYDCWHQGSEAVSVQMVIKNLEKNSDNAKEIIFRLIDFLPTDRKFCSCSQSLSDAIITDPKFIPMKTYRKLEIIIGKYIKNRI